MRDLKVNLNQKSHHKDHNEQFTVQTSMDTLNVLTQQHWSSIVLTVCKRYLSREHLMKHSAVHMQKSGNMQLTQSINLIDNDTWDLVELPEGRATVGCRWVFKVKHNGEGKVVRFKSRLVTKGYSQRHGNDFEETFSPVVRFSSI